MAREVTWRFRPIVTKSPAAASADGGAGNVVSVEDAAAQRAASLEEEMRRAREECRKAGYEEGLARGAADARARVGEPLSELVEALKAKLAEVDALLAGVAPEVARMIINHAVFLAEALIGSPCAFDRGLLARKLVAEAEAAAGPGRRVICRAHPDTIAAIEQDLRHAGCTPDPCPSMAPGGVVVSAVDANLKREVAEWDASVTRQVALLKGLILEGKVGP